MSFHRPVRKVFSITQIKDTGNGLVEGIGAITPPLLTVSGKALLVKMCTNNGPSFHTK